MFDNNTHRYSSAVWIPAEYTQSTCTMKCSVICSPDFPLLVQPCQSWGLLLSSTIIIKNQKIWFVIFTWYGLVNASCHPPDSNRNMKSNSKSRWQMSCMSCDFPCPVLVVESHTQSYLNRVWKVTTSGGKSYPGHVKKVWEITTCFFP